MRVFDIFDRSDLSFASYGEENFSFLNRSNRPEFVAASEMIEDWFSRYPSSQQIELASRFRDKNTPQNFDSAFFELFLHEFFTRGGCEVVVHPESCGSSKRHDFLITTPTSVQFFLEAIVVTGVSQEERATQSRTDDFYNALNRVVSPDFLIIVRHFNFKPGSPIPLSKVRKAIQSWVDGLDYEQIMEIHQNTSYDALPTYDIQVPGGFARLVAVPKKREARGLPNVPAVGGNTGDEIWVHTHEDIKSAIKKKSPSKYDVGDSPYVIALRCQDTFTRPIDIGRALFGLPSPEGTHSLGQLSAAYIEDGVWAGHRGTINTSISGVLSVCNLHPWSLQAATVCLYKNSWAKRPFDTYELSVTEAVLNYDGVTYRSCDSLQRFA
jgi:hypothetical protein